MTHSVDSKALVSKHWIQSIGFKSFDSNRSVDEYHCDFPRKKKWEKRVKGQSAKLQNVKMSK